MKDKKQGGLSRLLKYAGGHKKLTVLGCALSGIAALLGLAPYLCIWQVVRLIFAGEAAASVRYGWMAVGFALACILVYFAALMCTHLAAFRTARNMRQAAISHIVEVPLGFFTSNQTGRLRKIIDDNAGMTESLLAHQLPDLVGAVVTPLAAVALLFVFDWRMGLVCLLPMIFAVFLLTLMMGGKNVGFFSRYQDALERMSGEAVEYVRGIPVVKVFQQTVYSFKSFYRSILDYRELASGYAMGCRAPMTGFTAALNGTFLLLIPAGMLLAGAAGGENGWTVLLNFIFYVLFAPACATMMTRIMYASEATMQADEAMRKMDDILSVQPLSEPQRPQRPQDGGVEFNGVSFTYPGALAPALDNVSFVVPQGATVALVGPSGGGKSTAAALIPRFWDVDSGSVRVGGVDVRQLAGRVLMERVAFVFQDTRLFKATVLENIRMARPAATREQVLEAAHAAQCDDILSKLPQGLDTVVGAKGIYLSGGEAQRIALARAILKDAPIVVLDEATAFADPENEALIQQAFTRLTRGKTVLMIAHRLSTVKSADKILVLDSGKLLEQGTHSQLLEQDGAYAAMWRDYQSAASWKVGKEASV